MTAKFLDDLHPGEKFVTGGITLTESEIIAFALTYDPQPFHLNAVVAAESIYGGLIASLVDCHSTGTAAAAACRTRRIPWRGRRSANRARSACWVSRPRR